MTVPLLSIILIGRDDNYTKDFSERLNFCIAYNDYVLQKTNVDIELCFVEWGSKTLYQKINTARLKKFKVRWLHVDTTTTTATNEIGINIPLANNIGIRNANGKFLLLGPSDNLLSQPAALRLIELIQSPKKYALSGRELFLIPRRFLHKNWSSLQFNFQQLDKYFLLQSNANYPFIDQKTNINAGMGSMLAQKKIWLDARGLSEAKASHGGDDIELLSRLTEKYLQIDTSVFGIWQYKLARTEGTRSMIADQGGWAEGYLSTKSKKNPKNWGFHSNITDIKIKKHNIDPPKSTNSAKPPFASLDSFSSKITFLFLCFKTLRRHKFKYILAVNEFCASVFLSHLIKAYSSCFLILDEDLFFSSGKIIFEENLSLFGLVCFSEESSANGDCYKSEFINSISSLGKHNYHGHISAHRHDGSRIPNLTNRAKRFAGLGNHFAFSKNDGEIVQNFELYAESFPLMNGLLVKKEGGINYNFASFGFEKKLDVFGFALFMRK